MTAQNVRHPPSAQSLIASPSGLAINQQINSVPLLISLRHVSFEDVSGRESLETVLRPVLFGIIATIPWSCKSPEPGIEACELV